MKELVEILSIVILNLIIWIFYLGKFVGRVNTKLNLSSKHDPPCADLKELRNKVNEKLEIIANEIVAIRERITRIETMLEDERKF